MDVSIIYGWGSLQLCFFPSHKPRVCQTLINNSAGKFSEYSTIDVHITFNKTKHHLDIMCYVVMLLEFFLHSWREQKESSIHPDVNGAQPFFWTR